MKMSKIKSLLERKAENPEYQKRHEGSYEAFKLEAQMLFALERKGWSYSDLAEVTHTSKSNISRDLKAGGLFSAAFSRISRMADALGMKLIAILVPKEQVRFIVPKIEDLVRESFNAVYAGAKFKQPALPPAMPSETVNGTAGNINWQSESNKAGSLVFRQASI
jgi:transcriptional regulator with XRE-family HTH domain